MKSLVLRRLLVLAAASLLVLVSLLPVAAQDAAPTVGDIAVDSYDCDTGNLRFRVPVTDLPHIPDSNGPLGYSVTAHYEQGSDTGLPAGSFNPETGDAPYTGDVQLSTGVAPDAADSASPEDASGALQSIDISVSVGAGDGTDTSSTTYEVECDGADEEDTSPPSEGAGTDDPGTDGAEGDDADGDVSGLPSTGAGSTGPASAVASSLAVIAALLLLTGSMILQTSGRR